MIKRVISKIFNLFRHLFLKLRVLVTLQVGKEEDKEDKIEDCEHNPKKGESDD